MTFSLIKRAWQYHSRNHAATSNPRRILRQGYDGQHERSLTTRASDSTPSSSTLPKLELDEELKASIRKFDHMSPRPQNLQRILQVSSSASNIQEINSFLRDEFRIRCAERICMLDEQIPDFAEIPELQQVYSKHVASFVQMSNHNPGENDFLPVVRDIVERGRDIVPLLCKGMSRLITSSSRKEKAYDQKFTNKFMNEFLLNRIGSNVLMSQYLAVATGNDPPHPTSILDPHCNVTAICREAARTVQSLCYQETGYRPTIQVESHEQERGDLENFAFIPPVISYVLQELLKNSAVATAKKREQQKKQQQQYNKITSSGSSRGKAPDDEKISVIVCADNWRVMIHVADRAGGIPFESAPHVWSYLYSTRQRGKKQQQQQQQQLEEDEQQLLHGHQGTVAAATAAPGDNLNESSSTSSSPDNNNGATDLGGYGVGLPLSRLYASYLGGTINLVSLPGHGTHAYVFLPRLPEKMVETVPVRKTGWKTNNTYDGEFIL